MPAPRRRTRSALLRFAAACGAVMVATVNDWSALLFWPIVGAWGWTLIGLVRATEHGSGSSGDSIDGGSGADADADADGADGGDGGGDGGGD